MPSDRGGRSTSRRISNRFVDGPGARSNAVEIKTSSCSGHGNGLKPTRVTGNQAPTHFLLGFLPGFQGLLRKRRLADLAPPDCPGFWCARYQATMIAPQFERSCTTMVRGVGKIMFSTDAGGSKRAAATNREGALFSRLPSRHVRRSRSIDCLPAAPRTR